MESAFRFAGVDRREVRDVVEFAFSVLNWLDMASLGNSLTDRTDDSRSAG
jgi:hypothetical protein